MSGRANIMVERVSSESSNLFTYLLWVDGEAAVVDLCGATAETIANLLGEQGLTLTYRLYTHAYQQHAGGGELGALLHDLGLDDGALPLTSFQRLSNQGRSVAPVGPLADSRTDEALVVQIATTLLELNPRCELPLEAFVWQEGVGRPGRCTKRLQLALGTTTIEVLAVSGSARRLAYHTAGHLFTGAKHSEATNGPPQVVLNLLSAYPGAAEAPRVYSADTAETEPVPSERQASERGTAPLFAPVGTEPAMRTCSTCGTQFEAHVPMCFIDGTPLEDLPLAVCEPPTGLTGGGSPTAPVPPFVSKGEITPRRSSEDRTLVLVLVAVIAVLGGALALGVIAVMGS